MLSDSPNNIPSNNLPNSIEQAPEEEPKKLSLLKLLLFALLFLLISGCVTYFYISQISKKTVPSTPVSKELKKPTIKLSSYSNFSQQFKDKIVFVAPILIKFQEIAAKTNDPVADKQLNFALQHLEIVNQNNPSEKVRLTGKFNPQSSKNVKLYIIEPTDVALGEPFITYTKFGSLAAYDPQNKVIILRKDNSTSSQWAGMILLHEIYHANDYAEHNYDYSNSRSRAEREVAVALFLRKPYAKTATSDYQSYYSKMKQYLLTTAQKNRLELKARITSAYYYDQMGADGFEKPLSYREDTDHSNSIALSAAMEVLAKVYPDSATQYQTDLMVDIYNN